jgi:hypothetical protein
MGANAVTTVPVYVAGEVLTAADLNITNSGIPVFADSTARDNSFGGTGEKVLAEGQYAFLESTNQTLVYDGANWVSVGATPGLIPMVPTSVAVGSGTGTANALGQVTFSGASTVSLNGVFTSAYRNYKVVGQFLTSAGADASLRLRAAGSDNSTASSYTNQRYIVTSALIPAEDLVSNLAQYLPNAQTTLINSFSAEFFNPQIASATAIITSAISNQNDGYWTNCGIIHNQTVSYDGFSIFLSGAATYTGTLSVYGYNQ